jgi:hypothetical protein
MQAIAEQFGIVRQRVHQILHQHGELHPPVRRRAVTAEGYCAGCGKLMRLSVTALRNRRRASRSGNIYCSNQCSTAVNDVGALRRKLMDVDILRAIELRATTTLPWSAIGATFGVKGRTVQARIWKHLAATEQLTEAAVRTLWRPYKGVMSWRGWEKMTGHHLPTAARQRGQANATRIAGEKGRL